MKEVAGSYTVECRGADDSFKLEVVATLTVYNNGTREIGCPFVSSLAECNGAKVKDDGENNFGKSLLKRCVHLFPADTSVETS
ncbi:hypothetical protein A3A60_00375 [Candidatus Curtissbacteria bacterium RIFCSPLOWO2_01_FULL_42_26]|uniref:Uncharacterized protein n=1 Tax=Candidatus Curtissbacteria bacterium RIFCSPLOWO2_01_FULL_42_26 TaxID=1797729 RepID=A0A1F5HW37_9BACT|nr:MAG: hypothetical protein A3A60_00375 [Candidatus Curtissbacteria bacterium RIFCSPLOWO2_01_FULL_42_26]